MTISESQQDQGYSQGNPGDLPACLPTKQWYAVYTIVRHEKAANARVAERGIDTFLPLREIKSRWKDRIKTIQSPLFPGYFFVNMKGSVEEQLNVLNTRGVVRILADGPNPVAIPDEQIRAIQMLVHSQMEYEQDPYDLKGGDAIVARGPLSGVRGKIIEQRGSHRLILSVDLIQRSVAVEVDIRDVELR